MPTTEGLRLSLLGGLRASAGDVELVLPTAGQRLLALLALRCRLTRAEAAGLLWGDADEQHALRSMRTVLWRLNDLVGVWVDVHREVLTLAPAVRTDVARVEHALARLREGAPAAEVVPDLHCAHLDLLPGWDEHWLALDRERLRELQLDALRCLARAHAREGDHGAALEAAHRALRLEPLRESSHRLLVELHLAEGDYGAALERYRSCVDLLARELGVAPSPQMRALVLDLLGSQRAPRDLV